MFAFFVVDISNASRILQDTSGRNGNMLAGFRITSWTDMSFHCEARPTTCRNPEVITVYYSVFSERESSQNDFDVYYDSKSVVKT